VVRCTCRVFFILVLSMKLLIWAFLFRFIFKDFHFVFRLYTLFRVFLISKLRNSVDCIRFSECFLFQSDKTLSIVYAFRSVFDFKVTKPCRLFTLFGVFLISKWQNPADCLRFSELLWYQNGKPMSIIYAFRSVFDFKVAKPCQLFTLFGVILI